MAGVPRCRLIGSLVLAVLAAALGLLPNTLEAGAATSATATVPPAGPRLAVAIFRVYPRAGSEVRTMGPAGAAPARIAGGPNRSVPAPIVDSQALWSPDGEQVAFTGPAGEEPGTYLVRSNGSDVHLLSASRNPGGPRTFIQEPPAFLPSGALVASVLELVRGHFERSRGDRNEGPPVIAAALWSIPTDGSKPHPFGPFQRRRAVVPSSSAEDGTLVAMVYDRAGGRIATLDPRGGPIRTVVRDPSSRDSEPVLTPDGSRIAFLRDHLRRGPRREEVRIHSTDLMIVPASGGQPRLVTSVRGGARWPSWDPSGSRLAFTRLDGGAPFKPTEPKPGNALMQINADGTCLETIYSTSRDVVFGSSWQPGPGRGPGPIAC